MTDRHRLKNAPGIQKILFPELGFFLADSFLALDK